MLINVTRTLRTERMALRQAFLNADAAGQPLPPPLPPVGHAHVPSSFISYFAPPNPRFVPVHSILPDEFILPYKLAERALNRATTDLHANTLRTPTPGDYAKQGKIAAFVSELNFIKEALRMVKASKGRVNPNLAVRIQNVLGAIMYFIRSPTWQTCGMAAEFAKIPVAIKALERVLAYLYTVTLKDYTPEHESLDVIEKGIKRAVFLIETIPKKIKEITRFERFVDDDYEAEPVIAYYDPNDQISLMHTSIAEYLVLPETATRGEYAALLQAAWEKANRDFQQYMQMEAMVEPVYDKFTALRKRRLQDLFEVVGLAQVAAMPSKDQALKDIDSFLKREKPRQERVLADKLREYDSALDNIGAQEKAFAEMARLLQDHRTPAARPAEFAAVANASTAVYDPLQTTKKDRK